jgi:2-methylcitrate dehydratase PrpD
MKMCLADFIGVACAGHGAESTLSIVTAVRRLTREASGAGGAPAGVVIGSGWRTTSLYAALLNGTLGHSMDFDDTNSGRGGHPGVAVVPAALAAAQRSRCDGRTLLSGMLAGYETAARVGAALGRTTYQRGFHPTAIAGTFGAIAAAGRIQGAAPGVIEDAFGLGGSMCSGSRQYLENGAWNKRLHGGLAAHNGLMALIMAESGVRGAAEPLEGALGVLHGYSAAPSPAVLTDGLGETWLASGVSFKPYPAPRMAHSSLDAVLDYRAGGGAVDDSLCVSAWLSPAAYDLVGAPLPRKLQPRNIVDAQFSIYFLVAAALVTGDIQWPTYRRFDDPAIRELASSIAVTADESLPELGARLEFRSGAGAVVREVPVPRGNPGNPMGRESLLRKFRGCAGSRLGLAKTAVIEDLIFGLEQARCGDVGKLLELLGRRGPQSC